MPAAATVELLVLAVLSMMLYFPLNRGHARYYFESPVDAHLPFIPCFIFPYLALFPGIVLVLALMLVSPYAPQFYLALIVGVLAGSLTRYFVHSGVHRPEVRGTGVCKQLVHWLYQRDDRAHTFPSSHVLISLIAGYYLSLAYPAWAALAWAGALFIASSTMFVKQHFVFDVLGGLVFAVVAIHFAGLLLPVV